MKKLLFGFFILLFAISCKKGAAKLDINDVEAHRAYQDTILNRAAKNSSGFQETLKALIYEYNGIDVTDSNSEINLNYYKARLYDNVYKIPLLSEVIDTTNANKWEMIDSITYINYKDSARLFAKKVLDKSPNNIRAFYLYSSGIYSEWINFINSKYKFPFIGTKSKKEFSEIIGYIEDNAFKFHDIDTTENKIISQQILEFSYFFVVSGILNYNYKNVDYSNKYNLQLISKLKDFDNILNNANDFYILKKDYYISHKDEVSAIYNNAIKKLELIKKAELEEAELARNTITINHDGSGDWDKEATSRNVGEEVWSACYNNPNAVKVILNISDKCNDSYGKSTIYTSTIVLNLSDIRTYRKYQTASAFNANCFDWGLKLLKEYKPCGRSQFDEIY